MAQALEKIFLQKVAQMPQEEVELLPPPPKGKARKPGPPPASGNSLDVTDKLLEVTMTCCFVEGFQLNLSLSHPNRKPTINSTDSRLSIFIMPEFPPSAGSDSRNSRHSGLDHHLQRASRAPCRNHDANRAACRQSKTSRNI